MLKRVSNCFVVVAALMNPVMSYAKSGKSLSSSKDNVILFEQALESESAQVKSLGQDQKASDVTAEKWRGFGLRTGIAVEALEFLQLGLSHNFILARSKAAAHETLQGSRLAADLGLVFTAPIGKLRLGAGYTVGKYDYQIADQSSGFMGNGYYHGIGFSHAASKRVSIFGEMRNYHEDLQHQSGAESEQGLIKDSKSFSVGIKISL